MLAFGAFLLLFSIALLAIPVEVTIRLRRDNQFMGEFTIGWLFGLVRFPVTTDGAAESAQRRPSPLQRSGSGRGGRLLRNAPFRRRLFRFLGEALGAVRLRHLHLSARVGLDDPADTGRLWGFVGPLAAWLAARKEAEVSVVPVFDGATLAFVGSGEARVVPLTVAGVVGRFLLSPTTLRALWSTR